MTVAMGVLGSLVGCAGSLKDPAEFEADSGSSTTDAGGDMPACATDVPPVVFQQTCGVVGCHNPAARKRGSISFRLTSPPV
jgi:hypothetical protein